MKSNNSGFFEGRVKTELNFALWGKRLEFHRSISQKRD